MIFLCYPKCTTCQKAEKWLIANGVTYEKKDITVQTPNAEELKEILTKSGLPVKKLFNTCGLKYKELNLKEQLTHMSEEEALTLLASDGMLLKRPLFIGEDFVLVGFKEADWVQKLP